MDLRSFARTSSRNGNLKGRESRDTTARNSFAFSFGNHLGFLQLVNQTFRCRLVDSVPDGTENMPGKSFWDGSDIF